MSLLSNWQNYHLFYHGDRDLLLGKLVAPLLGGLIDRTWIDHCYFVRYALGGPHVRLRVRPRSGHEQSVEDLVKASAERFFAHHPSEQNLPVEAIRAKNRRILLSDPNEDGDAVFPNNSLQVQPLRFELERYGGPDYLEHSLAFFAISSLQVLLLLLHGDEPVAKRLAQHARILGRQAWGFASTEDEFLTLLDYPADYWGHDLASIRSEGDRVYEARRPAFQRLLREALLPSVAYKPPLAPTASPDFVEASRALSREVRASKSWRRVCQSHLHMTANRLGLSNPDEVYLGRLLWRAAIDLTAAAPEGGQHPLTEWRSSVCGPRLADLLDPALSALSATLAASKSAELPP